jgi:hypothetical protein
MHVFGGVSLAELSKDDLLIILKLIANMVRYLGLFVIPTIIVAVIYGESSHSLLFLAMAALMIVPFSAIYSNMRHIGNDVSLKHGILAIAIGWFVVGIIFAIPYIAEGFSPVDSFFEATSGLSTTGLTMIPHPSKLPFSVNFWRAFTQWFGGFGIVVLALMFFEKPKAAQGLFVAEGRAEGFYNNVYKIARIIMGIYLLYTALGIILYLWSGMDLFNAVVHCFTALSTGGFSTDDTGVGAFGRPAMLVTMAVTCIGGINALGAFKGQNKGVFLQLRSKIVLCNIVCFHSACLCLRLLQPVLPLLRQPFLYNIGFHDNRRRRGFHRRPAAPVHNTHPYCPHDFRMLLRLDRRRNKALAHPNPFQGGPQGNPQGPSPGENNRAAEDRRQDSA